MRYSENFQGLFSCQTQVKNKMPAWDFRSSYGGLTSQAYRKARQRLEADIHILSGLVLSLTPKSLGP